MLEDLESFCETNLIKKEKLEWILDYLNNRKLIPLKLENSIGDIIVIKAFNHSLSSIESILIIQEPKKMHLNWMKVDSRNFYCDHLNHPFNLLILHFPEFCWSLELKIKSQQQNKNKCVLIDGKQILQIVDIVNTLNLENLFSELTPLNFLLNKEGKVIFNPIPTLFQSSEDLKGKGVSFYQQTENPLDASRLNYSVGIIFLELLGLTITEKIANDIRNGDFSSTNELPHQDFVKIIQRFMICSDKSQRISFSDLYWLLKLTIFYEEPVKYTEISSFIQNQIKFDFSQIEQMIQSNTNIQNHRRINKELGELIKSNFERIIQNGCFVTKITEEQMSFSMIGAPQSIFENRILNFSVDFNKNPYPYQPLIYTLESDVDCQHLVNKNKHVIGDFLSSQWSPASSIITTILSVASLFNLSSNVDFQSCVEKYQFSYDKPFKGLNDLETLDSLLSKHKSQFLLKFSIV